MNRRGFLASLIALPAATKAVVTAPRLTVQMVRDAVAKIRPHAISLDAALRARSTATTYFHQMQASLTSYGKHRTDRYFFTKVRYPQRLLPAQRNFDPRRLPA